MEHRAALESVGGDLLNKLGRYEEARAAFEAAAALAGNKRERDLPRRHATEAATQSAKLGCLGVYGSSPR
jgi:predicted RNA polymerase sigma factor